MWEIGHTDLYGTPPGKFCLPGDTGLRHATTRRTGPATSPLRIVSVQFAHSKATTWGVVSDYGGADEVRQTCKIYGKPYCTYPWFAWDGKRFTYGVNFPGTKRDFGQGRAVPDRARVRRPLRPRQHVLRDGHQATQVLRSSRLHLPGAQQPGRCDRNAM